MDSIILYSSYSKLTEQHHPVQVGDKTIYIRAVSSSKRDLMDALDEAADSKLEGEIVLNTIFAPQ